MAQQILSANLKKLIQDNQILPYKVSRNEIGISHLLYADDILVFTNGSARSLRHLQHLFHQYEVSSGQRINSGKNGMYMGKGAAHRQSAIETITGIRRKSFPLMYLLGFKQPD